MLLLLLYKINSKIRKYLLVRAFIGIGLFIHFTSYGQPEGFVKSHLSVLEGLSQNEVTTISEDKYGFLWFGTRGGLNRYDGYRFRHYKHSGDNSKGLENPSIERLYVNNAGELWIGTKSGGFSIYDPALEKFSYGNDIIPTGQERVISFLHDMEGGFWSGSFANGLAYQPPGMDSVIRIPGISRVSSIIQTPDSSIWIGTPQGLLRKSPGGEFQVVDLLDRVYEITRIIYDDSNQCLWIAGWGVQLVRYDIPSGSFELFPLPYRSERSFNTYSLLMDSNNQLWIGTWGEGLYRFDPETEEFRFVNLNRSENFSNVSDFNIVLDIFQDKQGIIWVGTDGGGIVKFSPSLEFRTIEDFGQDLKVHVNSICISGQGQYLFGTRGQGLIASADLENFYQLKADNQDATLDNQSVYFLDYFDQDNIWAGTEQGAMILIPGINNEMKAVRAGTFFQSYDLDIPRKVLSILNSGNDLWMGTQQQGLYLFHRENGKYTLVKNFSPAGDEGLTNSRISNLISDSMGNIWVGTYNGLYRYNQEDSIFTPIESLMNNPESPLCNIVLSLTEDQKGRIWYGTPCSLNRLIQTGKGRYSLKQYTAKEGLPDDYVSNIIADDSSNIWLTTNRGISKLIAGKNEFQNFEASDGTGKYTFSEAAEFTSIDGRIFFGGFAGVTYFDPGEIKINQYVPPIVITNFKILNSEVFVGENNILPASINELQKLRLTHREREVSIEFASLDYKSPLNNQYAYRLDRSNEQATWVYTGTKREVSLQNLNPGHYILYLSGTNSNGLWNRPGRTLEIEVIPAPWESWYAIVIYIVILLGIVILIVNFSLRQERLKTQADLEHIKLEKEKQLNEYKLRFFTNISHEFRTPLSLILAPINDLINMDKSKMNKDVSRKIRIIYKNANKLLKLVNQLLEFRKIEVGKAKLEASLQNYKLFCREIIEPFEELADQKGVKLNIKFKVQNPEIYFDQQKMSVVLNNLLSNAFKYCGDPGTIIFTVTENDQEIITSISNDGKEISEKDRGNIFDRFYHISSDSYQGSSGIGLALVRNYVEMHSGNATVESSKDGMTTFSVNLLKGKSHLEPDMIVEQAPIVIDQQVFSFPEEETEVPAGFYHHGSKGSTILIVEDNIEVIQYLQSLLSDYYEIEYSMNGKDGFDKAIDILPDLIISDVMMPEMDGFELCKKIRNNEKLSHLPVILLTAKDTPGDILFGIKKGADAYITKPFDSQLVMEKIKQLLLSRTQLSKKYSKRILLEPTDKEITSADEKFINSALKYVENNISNTELNLEDMARELAMSSTTMYRRMKAVINQSPGEFIRTVKFKRAAQLLRDTMLTVSEIIEMVGYQDAKRFRENFRNEFGLTPGEYREQFKNDPGSPQSHQDPEVR